MRVLITGASRGLGREIACLLHDDGHEVIAVLRNAEHAHPPWSTIGCDLRDPNAVARLAADIEASEVDVFVHAAATAPANADRGRIADAFNVNVVSAIVLADAVVPAMIARGSGSLVFVSSLAALCPIDGFSVYGATKAALDAYAQALRARVPDDVRVLLVRPGRMATDFFHSNGFAADVVERARTFPPALGAAQAVVARLDDDGEYVHGPDRWLLRAKRLLPRPLGRLVWKRFT
jgi:short-subunit dehydrogenase